MTPVLDALRGPGPCARTALAFAEASAHLAPPALGRLLQEARAVLDSAGGTAWLAEAIERAVEPGDDAPDAAGFDAAHAAYCALLAGRIVASGKPARAARRELEEISAAAARAAIAALLGTRTDLDPQEACHRRWQPAWRPGTP